MNIFLIGYRCTGKTTVGREIARRTGLRFVDADAWLVTEAGVTIAEIVSKSGWDAFRKIETSVLARIAASDNQVVATGGGVVLDAQNRALMKARGVAVWLCASPETVYNRMIADKHSLEQRPALTDQNLRDEITDTLAARHALYAAAMTLRVDTDGKSIETICDLILSSIADERKTP